MRKAAARRFEVTLSAKGATRLLLAIYFLGLGLGAIRGVEIDILLRAHMPDGMAGLLSGALIVALALLLLRKKPRTAALLLSVLVFWASYLNMLIRNDATHMADFWRDLALIGGLIFTSGASRQSVRIDLGAPVGAARDRLCALLPMSANADPDTALAARSGTEAQPPSSAAHPKRVRSELYRQDFEVARVL